MRHLSVEEVHECNDEGYKHALAGGSRKDNPYSDGNQSFLSLQSQRWVQWRVGWQNGYYDRKE